MEADPKAADSGWFVVPAREKPRTQSEPIILGDRIKKVLGIAEWSDLLAEGDEPYFGF
jgi:hypothetical protein